MSKRGTAPTLTCPVCGTCYAPVQKRQARSGKRARKSRRSGQRFEFTAPSFEHAASPAVPIATHAPLDPGAERTIEHNRAEMPIDVATYLLKGAGIGAGVALLSVPLTLIDGVAWWVPLIVWPAGTGLGILASTVNPREWLQFAETVFQRDLDGDGDVGAPQPQRVLGTVVVEEPARNSSRYLHDIPLSDELGRYLAALLADPPRATFSESSAASFGAGDEFGVLRDQLMEREMIRWKNPSNHRSGYVFTQFYDRALAELLEMCRRA